MVFDGHKVSIDKLKDPDGIKLFWLDQNDLKRQLEHFGNTSSIIVKDSISNITVKDSTEKVDGEIDGEESGNLKVGQPILVYLGITIYFLIIGQVLPSLFSDYRSSITIFIF